MKKLLASVLLLVLPFTARAQDLPVKANASGVIVFPGNLSIGPTFLTPGSNGQVLTTSSGAVVWANASTSAGGSTTQLQYNNGGVLAGTSGLTWTSANGQFQDVQNLTNYPSLFTVQNTNTGVGAGVDLEVANSANAVSLGITSTLFSGTNVPGGPSGQSACLVSSGAIPLIIGANNNAVMNVAYSGVPSLTLYGTFTATSGASTFAGMSSISSTQSTSTATGSFVTGGGIGLAGNLWSGGSLNGATLSISSTSTLTGNVGIGGASTADVLHVAGTVSSMEYITTTSAISQLSIDQTAGNSTDASQINFRRNTNSKAIIGINLGNVSGDNLMLSVNGSVGLSLEPTGTSTAGRAAFTPAANTTGANPAFTVQTPNDTGITASTEDNLIQFGSPISTPTLTWATGAITKERYIFFAAPFFAASGASTMSIGASVAINGAPGPGTNMTITTGAALWIQNGDSPTGLVGEIIGSQTGGLSNNTDLLIGAASTPIAPTGNFGIYQQDSYANLFGGNVSVGTGSGNPALIVNGASGAASGPYIDLQVAGAHAGFIGTSSAGGIATNNNMVIVAKTAGGTGILNFYTNNATLALTLDTSQNATFAGSLTDVGSTHGAAAWKHGGVRTSTALVTSTTTVIEVNVGGTLYDLMTCTTNP